MEELAQRSGDVYKRQLYNEENDTQKAQDEAFMLAAKVQLYDFFAATVDIFGDMPFSRCV